MRLIRQADAVGERQPLTSVAYDEQSADSPSGIHAFTLFHSNRMNKSVKQTSLIRIATKVTMESKTRGHEAFYRMLNHGISNRSSSPDNRSRLMSNGRPTDFTAGFFPSTQFKQPLDTAADECSAGFSTPSGFPRSFHVEDRRRIAARWPLRFIDYFR